MNPFAKLYDRPEVVAEYLRDVLEPPEVRLLHELVRQPQQLSMLDLGVGAGRTTGFFAPFARQYIGIDLAPRMITTCRERFGTLRGCDFRVGDAADLDDLADASCDIVLFSFNGIDCLDPDRRVVCLRSARRLLRAGGIFLFSAHNLQMVDFYFQPPSAGGEAGEVLTPERRAKIARHNGAPSTFAHRDWALFWDGVYGDDGELRHVYIRPRRQLAELRAIGFDHVHALSAVTGEEFSEGELDAVRDLSVAYWSEVGA
jgi:SAM-dependent methyltransferase